MNPKQFLQIGGVILLLFGILGFIVPQVGGLLTFNNAENWPHVVLGVVALVLAPLPLGELKRWVVVLVALGALFFGVAGFMVSGNPAPNFYGVAQLDNPVDNIIHIVVGIWGLLAAFNKKA